MKSYEQHVRLVTRGKMLKITRIVFNYEQSDMAHILGVSKSSVSQIEHGRRISRRVLENFLAIFKVEQNDFKRTEDNIVNLVLCGKYNVNEIAELVLEMLLKSNEETLIYVEE